MGDVCHHKKKNQKRKKKHKKKKRDKHKKKERKNVSKTVEKKQENGKKQDDDGDIELPDNDKNELLENKEVISLISPSPMIIEKNQNEKKRKRKRRKRKKLKSKEVLDLDIKSNDDNDNVIDLKEVDENGSDVHNVNLGEMNSLSIINDQSDELNGNGIADKSNDDDIIVID